MFSFLRLRLGSTFPLLPVMLLSCIVLCSLMLLWSAGSGLRPWVLPQMLRLGLGVILFLIVASVDLRFWLMNAPLFYVVSLVLLLAVEMLGTTGMGAKRWINLYVLQLQPSEVMKIALILFVSARFHFYGEGSPKVRHISVPLLAIVVPALLVLRQPDLGTAIILVAVGMSILFASGITWWFFVSSLAVTVSTLPVLWLFLKEYQKRRVWTFLNPEADPLGAGYHALQSKIAIGSGGIWGKGLGKGTQVQLDFLPEKHTDFVFTVLCEEWGLVGAACLLLLYLALIFYGYWIALNCHARFIRLLVVGVSSAFFFHVFINVGMVLGVLPVVGVPLPLVSYGGTSLLTFMVGLGWCVAADKQRHARLPHSGMSLG